MHKRESPLMPQVMRIQLILNRNARLSLAYVGGPHWDRLRRDARFQALLRRMGLPSK